MNTFLKSEKGFTLLEVAITMVVCVLVLISIVGANTMMQKMTRSQYQRITAAQDANQVIEQMKETASIGQFPANVTAAFPNGAAVAGFNNLSNEAVTVAYTNPALDLLDVTVTVNWLDEHRQNAVYTLNTLMTQRE